MKEKKEGRNEERKEGGRRLKKKERRKERGKGEGQERGGREVDVSRSRSPRTPVIVRNVVQCLVRDNTESTFDFPSSRHQEILRKRKGKKRQSKSRRQGKKREGLSERTWIQEACRSQSSPEKWTQ